MLDLTDFWGAPLRGGPDVPPPSRAEIEAWERQHSVQLPQTLARALTLQNGGYVRGTGLMLWPLRHPFFSPLCDPCWDCEQELNLRFGDPSRLYCIGQHRDRPGTIILDYNTNAVQPRVLWRWTDLGNELRDEGHGTFDDLILRLRETDQPLP